MPLPKLDHVVTCKLTTAQIRRCKQAAARSGRKFGVWAREAMLAAAEADLHAGNGSNGHRQLSAPVLPERA